MQPRSARLGLHVYEVRRATDACVYYRADSVTVTPAGVLIVAVEMPPIEALVDEEVESTLIENPPVAIYAPGQWHSCVLVTDDTHEPEFRQDVFERLYAGEESDTDE